MKRLILKKSLVPLFCFLLSVPGFAQQGNNWYFGFKGGLTFNTTPPSPLTNGMLSTIEGCSSISDENGNLLFYTDGITVYSKNHQPMLNGTGLKGDFSATQAALIVQQPGSDNIYYVFTANSQGFNLSIGYRYSVVDISLNNGLGEVIQKNILLYAPCTERLAAVRHANGIDVWIITNEFESNRIKTYKLDCNGLDPNPVVSSAGIVLTRDETRAVGHFKVSPDGKILCQTILDQFTVPFNCFQLFQFNNSTGEVSSPIKIPTPGSNYGAEFSPNSKLLYVSSGEPPEPRQVFQYSVAVYDSALIHDSRYIITTPFFSSTALQIGPDKKIYHAKFDSSNLAVIENPDVQGAGCNYISIGPTIGGKSAGGLPTFMGNYLTNQNIAITYTANADCSSIGFRGTTTIPGNVNWFWDFGDGSTSSDQNPVHTFPATANEFIVNLTVTPLTGCGKASSFTTINLSRPLLKANFTSTQVCGNPTIQFLDQSNISQGNISSWHWDFGDGNFSSAKSPSHTYSGTGNYTIKLVVSYSSSCVVKDSLSSQISIEPKPVADFSAAAACAAKPIQFTDRSAISAGSVAHWYWNFGDGNISTQQHPVHRYNTPGTYPVKMVAVSATGCISDTLYSSVEVSHAPVADFIVGSSCVSSPVKFTDGSSAANATVNQWYWNFGDASNATANNPSHLFTAAGNYIIKLAVSSDKGCSSDTLTRAIAVDAKPTASFTIDNGCTERNITPANNSSTGFGDIDRYYWSWGIDLTSGQFQPAISFTEIGGHLVKLVAYSAHGCISDTASAVVNIEETPSANFNFGNTCAGKEIQFENLSTGPVTSWNWNFGDGNISDQEQPVYTFIQYGNYNVSLTASTQNGCFATATKTVMISKVVVSAGNDTIAASGQSLQLKASGALTYTWQPATYLSSATSATPVANLPSDMTYYLRGITAEGCIGYDTIHIRTFKKVDIYVPTAFTPNADGKNDVFKPVYAGIRELVQFTVYNRWGQTMFTTKDMTRGWDGTLSGKEQDTNIFVWIARVIGYDGRIIEKKGTVTLIR